MLMLMLMLMLITIQIQIQILILMRYPQYWIKQNIIIVHEINRNLF